MGMVGNISKEKMVNHVCELLEDVNKVYGTRSAYAEDMRKVVEFWSSIDESEFNPPTNEDIRKMLSAQVSGYVFEMKRMQGINPYYGKKRNGVAPDLSRGLPEIVDL